MAETEYDADVVIVGAGPVGTWLAMELCAAGVSTLVLEARAERPPWSRGFTVHPRTLELFDSRHMSATLMAVGQRVPSSHFAMGQTRLDYTGLPTNFPFVLLHPQVRTEELIERRLTAVGGSVWRDWRVIRLRQHADRVEVDADTPAGLRHLTARYVIGCDGARSTVRSAAEIPFLGTDSATVSISGDVVLDNPLPYETPCLSTAAGMLLNFPLPGGRHMVAVIDHSIMRKTRPGPVAFAELQASAARVAGTDLGLRDPGRVTAVGDAAKQAERYRAGRVLLAGDAAHVHFPMGGQGLNLGVQDAHNLAWRLIAVLRAGAPDRLLDGYEQERRPVGEMVVEDVRAQVALATATGLDGLTLRQRFDDLLRDYPSLNRDLAARASGLAVRYRAEGGDPRLGARVPDLVFAAEVEVGAGAGANHPGRAKRVFETSRPGRFTLLDLTGGRLRAEQAVAEAGAEALVDAVAAQLDETRDAAQGGSAEPDSGLGVEQSAEQAWAGTTAVLIRPDGHAAWIGDDPRRAFDTLKGLLY